MSNLPGEVRMRATIFLCGLAFPALVGMALSHETAPPEESWCSERRVEGPGQDYQVGVPEDWTLESRSGISVVGKRPLTLAFVYRVRPGDPPVAQLVAEQVRALAGSGADLEVEGTRLHGRSRGVPVEGEVFLAVHGPDLIVTGGWAPTSDWARVQSRVEEVGRCYQRSPRTSG